MATARSAPPTWPCCSAPGARACNRKSIPKRSEDDDNGSNSGSAYLFDTTTGQQIAKLLADDGAVGDRLGISVAISGATAIVGAYYDDDNGMNSGSAYIFDITAGPQIGKLLPDDGAEIDWFGISVAISGSAAIVGAFGDDDNGDFSGSAYLFGGSPGPVETTCDDGLDNDGDGDIDCEDADCVAQQVCQEDCANGLDDDVDGDIDCEDSDCFDDPVCQEDCTNGIDDDLDDDTDCEDSDCAEHPACQEDCTNGLDDDVDGDIDCDDADCFADPACQEDCSNGIDDDLDGDVDCEDADCIGQPACP